MSGKVWLIGAGPGDPELLTLKAVRALGEADVVLVDDLVHAGVLAHARKAARVVRVGKRGGCKSTPQEFIERLMVAEARAGRVVARLKGGDPFVFGRGGEELEALAAEGVAYEVVNGLTAAFASGVPLTHRARSRGVAFVSGHGAEPDWQALARSGLTLVVYMGVARCEEIQMALLNGGLSPATPAAMIEQASLPGERRIGARLGSLASVARAQGLKSPALLVIGEVAQAASAGRTFQDCVASSKA